jgi:hypothetical protein
MNRHVPATPVAASAGDRANVFVSYSRKNAIFAQILVGALAECGFDAFLDKTDIAPGEPWQERLATLIATADTVVVVMVMVMGPDSVASTICGWELEESVRLGKRIIPVVARRIADADAPPELGRLNWVFLAEGADRNAALASLDTALHTDLAWVREHTRGETRRRRHGQPALPSKTTGVVERWKEQFDAGQKLERNGEPSPSDQSPRHPRPLCSGCCLPPARSTCARSMAGEPSSQSPSISQLTPQLDPIPSTDRRSRRVKFQPHSGRRLTD